MTERDIINGCQRGKAKYQKELVLRYSPMLMTIARRYCKDDPAAKDVLQGAFIRIFKAIPQYKATGSFRGWLRRIVINEALKKQERAAYQREQSGLADIGHPEVGPTVWKKLEAETAIQLIQQLPEGFRMVFNLYVFEDYSHQEIGEMLGISAATSRSQLARARQKLQVMIEQLEKEHYVKRAG
jgi:RNA polymerase sigma-70 factor (ECF subfamily)